MSKTKRYVLAGIVLTAFFAFILGGDETATTSATEVAKSATGVVTSSARFWGLFVLGLIALLLWSMVNFKSFAGKGKGRVTKLNDYVPPKWAFVVLLGITTFHWLFWAIAPEIWSQWLHSKTFWPMNLAAIALAPVVNFKLKGILWLAGFALFGFFLWEPLKEKWNKEVMSPAYASIIQEAPRGAEWVSPEVVLAIIANCESGGRQFDDEGNLIKNPESTAIGKYGIMASLHEERAKSMGLDIRTLEGNEAYANFLFSESGTKHWEVDPRSRACWEPKLLAYRGENGGAMTYVARVGQPVVISVPPMHRWDGLGAFPTEIYYSSVKVGSNLIGTFEVLPPATEVSFSIAFTKCRSVEECRR